MKKAYLLILFISIASQVFGQNNCLNEMIIDCLHAYVNHGAELNNNNENENGIYICKDGLPLGFPYEKITNATFFSAEFFPSYPNPMKKELRTGIKTLFVSFELIGNQLRITITSRRVKSVNKKTLDVGISDWGQFDYVYSCKDGKWIFESSRYEGI